MFYFYDERNRRAKMIYRDDKIYSKKHRMKNFLKKLIFDDKQNFRFDTKNSNKSTLYIILSNNMKKFSYLKKLFR